MNETAIPAKFRDINVIAGEIRTIQDSVRRTALEGAIEIGRRLTEAKELLPYGEWGSWLKTEFEYSQPTASRLMTLYNEYGADQSSLFGAESKYSALNNLSITKALRLVAIPSEEREEWAEEHKVEEISTRELDRLIKEKEEAERLRAEAEREKAETAELLNQKTDEYIALQAAASELRKQAENTDNLIAEAKKGFEGEKSALEKKLSKAWDARKSAEAKQAEAEKLSEKLKADMEKLRENPEIPPEIIEKAAEEKARSYKAETEAVKAELEKARKDLSMSCPSAAVFAAYFKQVQMDFNKMFEALEETMRAQPETGEKFAKAARAVVAQIGQRLAPEIKED